MAANDKKSFPGENSPQSPLSLKQAALLLVEWLIANGATPTTSSQEIPNSSPPPSSESRE